MADPQQAEIIEQGVPEWNAWRDANPQIVPDLKGADLCELDLSGINLSGANLADAELYGANLTGANLKMAVLTAADLSSAQLFGAELYKAELEGAFITEVNLSGAYLAEADLTAADLRGSVLKGADLTGALLVKADLTECDLSDANLSDSDIREAILSATDLAGANLFRLRYGGFRNLAGRCFAVRGLDSAFGNALFVRDARDQDYLETLRRSIDDLAAGKRRSVMQVIFRAWGWIDYGRSLLKPALYAVAISALFGVIYTLDMFLGWGLMDYSGSASSWLSPFYYSIVTYTTLGFGDITPQHWVGEIIVVVEVIMGYTTLGLLLSILANRVARQS